MDIKGKINHFTRDELKRIAPDLDINNFTFLMPWYDALEEYMLSNGFVIEDEHEDIELIKEWQDGHRYFKKYNIAVVELTKHEDKHRLQSIGMRYVGIRASRLNDLEKLSYVMNHLKPYTINGIPEDDGVKAQEYLQGYIDKMKELGVKNIKELLK